MPAGQSCRSITTASIGTTCSRPIRSRTCSRKRSFVGRANGYASFKTTNSSNSSTSAGTTTSIADTGRRQGSRPAILDRSRNIARLPAYTSDDVKTDQFEHPPFGNFHGDWHALSKVGAAQGADQRRHDGQAARHALQPLEWEMNGLTQARAMYIQGIRPGDVVQIPATCSLANLGWCVYKACHDYLGISLTTGSGIVTSSRRQLELAFDWGTSAWLFSRISDTACQGQP